MWLRPGLVEKLRDEVLPLVTFSAENGKRKATLDIRLVEKQCPLLLSCQREGVRVANHMVARRAITADTLLTDEDGTTVPTFCVSFPLSSRFQAQSPPFELVSGAGRPCFTSRPLLK